MDEGNTYLHAELEAVPGAEGGERGVAVPAARAEANRYPLRGVCCGSRDRDVDLIAMQAPGKAEVSDRIEDVAVRGEGRRRRHHRRHRIEGVGVCVGAG